MHKIQLLSAAIRDLTRGKLFYEKQKVGLGDYFIDCLSSDIDLLEEFSGIHRKISGYHRLLSKRFPYAIYYKCDAKTVYIYRILDCRQHPDQTAYDLS